MNNREMLAQDIAQQLYEAKGCAFAPNSAIMQRIRKHLARLPQSVLQDFGTVISTCQDKEVGR